MSIVHFCLLSCSTGQGHKTWCQYECEEEDVDWEVVPVLGKGLGIVARRSIPAGYQIIVEPVFSDPAGHPAIKDLMLENVKLKEKFEANAITTCTPEGLITQNVSLRNARVNHDCDPNATSVFSEENRVRIFAGMREIPAGQEVCRAYIPLYNPQFTSEAEVTQYRKYARSRLVTMHNIIFAPNCVCYDSHIEKLIVKAAVLTKRLEEMESKKSVPTLKPAEDLLELADLIPFGQYSKARANAYYCMAASTVLHLNPGKMWRQRDHVVVSKMSKAERKMKMDRASKCISACYDIYFAIDPFSGLLKTAKNIMQIIRESGMADQLGERGVKTETVATAGQYLLWFVDEISPG